MDEAGDVDMNGNEQINTGSEIRSPFVCYTSHSHTHNKFLSYSKAA